MHNKEHYTQFLEYLDIAKSEERDIREIILRTANNLATQNYAIYELLEKLLER